MTLDEIIASRKKTKKPKKKITKTTEERVQEAREMSEKVKSKNTKRLEDTGDKWWRKFLDANTAVKDKYQSHGYYPPNAEAFKTFLRYMVEMEGKGWKTVYDTYRNGVVQTSRRLKPEESAKVMDDIWWNDLKQFCIGMKKKTPDTKPYAKKPILDKQIGRA
eukprot:TRINITY_DN20504_c0_g1_i1.p2 TRINITY_DN20504_c0_g1~~TRINITY_DN20504_c0_g1_i1.p2  ORF type:complete len:162 (+),score=48.56 TRINITY_DN20504_c0_g1_i1:374-859(+)